MMSDVPKHDIGDVIYLRESAALGFLEAMRVGGISKNDSVWIYSLVANQLQPNQASIYGDRIYSTYGRGQIHSSSGAPLYFTEDEFLTLCEALVLIRNSLQSRLLTIESQIADLCSEGTE